MAKKSKKIFAIILAVLVVVSVFYFWPANNESKEPIELIYKNSNEDETANDYTDFLIKHKTTEIADAKSEIEFTSYDIGYLLLEAGTQSNFEVNIEQSGLYCVQLEYIALGETIYDYTFSIMIDGEYQYKELENLAVKSQWEVDSKNSNNGFSPKLKKTSSLLKTWIYDRNFYYDSPLQIYLSEGVHTISLHAGDYDIGIHSIAFKNNNKGLSYKEYESDLSLLEGKQFFIEGEYATYRSSSSILELSDSTSPKTSPMSVGKNVRNTIGGETFSKPGDYITWKFNVKEAGTYYLSIRYRQDFTNGSTSYRTILIDGDEATMSFEMFVTCVIISGIVF